MNRILTLIAISVLILLPSVLSAQAIGRDVVYLKNGSVIKGIIIEQVPNSRLKIQTGDGSIFAYEFTEIERIEKEETVNSVQDDAIHFLGKAVVTLQVGVMLPAGEFAATTGNTGGAASVGYGLGGELRVPVGRSFFWLLSTMFAFNSVNEEAFRNSLGIPSNINVDLGNWISITPMTGLGAIFPTSPTMALLFSARIGLLIGSSPEIAISSGSNSLMQGSSSGTAFAYGFSGGILLSTNFSVCLQYQSGKPKYTATATGGGSSTSATFEQSMTLVQIVVGVGL